MISSQFDFDDFVAHAQLLDGPDAIIAAALREITEAKELAYGTGRSSPTRQDSDRYVGLLQGFLFFMRYALKPAGLGDEDFARLKPLCVLLVKKGVLKPAVLDLFGQSG